MQTTQENVRAAFTGMDALSTQLTTHLVDDSKTTTTSISATQQQPLDWPFVTFAEFAQLAEDARNITGAIQIVFAPLVRKEDQAVWEAYSADHQEWVLGEEPVDTNYRWRRRRQLQLRHASNNTSSSSLSSASSSRLPETTGRIYHETRHQQQVKDLEALTHNTVHVRYPQQSLPPPSKRQLQAQEEILIPRRIHPRPSPTTTATGEEEERLYYAPVWQMSPTPFYRGIVNHDLLSSTSFQRLSQQVQETQQGVISNQLKDDLVGLFLNPHGVPRNRDTNDEVEEGEPRDSEDYPPMSVLVQPVWRRLFSQTEAAHLAGYLVALIPWEAYVSQSFGAESDETLVLAQYDYGEVSSCPPPPTEATSYDDLSNREELLNYKVKSGDQVDFLGPGDDFPGHDKFEYAKRSTMDFPLEPSSEAAMVVAGSNHTVTNKLLFEEDELVETTNNNTPECGRLRINMYPSDELRDLYMTNYPMYYALLVVLVFVILAAAFFIYNVFVERRRGRVMAVAEKTGRIVTNLFPTHFADQLISEDKKKDKAAKKKKKKVIIEEAPNRRLKKYMKDKNKFHNDINGEKVAAPSSNLGYGDASPDGGAVDGDDSPLFLAQSKPIADLFPETTVLFADIAGKDGSCKKGRDVKKS